MNAVNKIVRYFGITIDKLVKLDGNIHNEMTNEDKCLIEQLKLIA